MFMGGLPTRRVEPHQAGRALPRGARIAYLPPNLRDADARQLELWRQATNRHTPGTVEVYVRFQINGVRYSGEQVPQGVIASLMGVRPLPKLRKTWRPSSAAPFVEPKPQRQLQVAW
jgi:hypothetical protein